MKPNKDDKADKADKAEVKEKFHEIVILGLIKKGAFKEEKYDKKLQREAPTFDKFQETCLKGSFL